VAIGQQLLIPLQCDNASGLTDSIEYLNNAVDSYSSLLGVLRDKLEDASSAVAKVVLAATLSIVYAPHIPDDDYFLEELAVDISQYTAKGHHGIAYVLLLRRLQYNTSPTDGDVQDMIHMRNSLIDSIGAVIERQDLEEEDLLHDLADTQLFMPRVLFKIPAIRKAVEQDGRRDCLRRPVGHILYDNKVDENFRFNSYGDGVDVLGRSRLHIASTLGSDEQRNQDLLSLPTSAWPEAELLKLNAFYVAAIHGNTYIFRIAETSGYDVVYSLKKHLSAHTQRTYLHWAACLGHLELVEYFLDRYRAMHDSMYLLVYLDRDKDTALHLAARNGHAEVVKAILIHTDWSQMKSVCFHHTPFWAATTRGHLHIMKILASVSNVDEPEEGTLTPLAEAARQGFLDCIEYLLNFDGVDIDSANKCWDDTAKETVIKTPLDLAFEGGHTECTALLVQHGASTWHFDMATTQISG
jgi:ankyrin repeat protein